MIKLHNAIDFHNYSETYISTEAGSIYCKIYGKNKTKVPLLIVHGGPGATYDYLEPLSELAIDRPVIFYDQISCGNSDKVNDKRFWSVDYYVQELHTIRATLGLDEMHLLGQSWGGGLSTKYVLKYADKGIKSLILSAPLLSTPLWIEDQNKYISELPEIHKNSILRSESNGDYSTQEYQDAMMYYYNIHLCRFEIWPNCVNKTFERMNLELYNYMWGPSEFKANGTLKYFDLSNELSKLDLPVLITCGRFDEAHPESMAKFNKLIKNSRLVIFEDASHQHHLEQQDDYIELVANFIKNND